LKVISNGVRWAAQQRAAKPVYGNHLPLEAIKAK
jgi:trehalose utilization protein